MSNVAHLARSAKPKTNSKGQNRLSRRKDIGCSFEVRARQLRSVHRIRTESA
jgi:hypothetical protein